MHTQTQDLAPVSVGTTSFPLKPASTDRGPVPVLPSLAGQVPSLPPMRLPDGPPYANGSLHLGHVLNKHLKDCLVRAWHAQGHGVDWRPGWDCHGLPIELAVEKSGADRADRLAFAAACREFASHQVHNQCEQFLDQGVCMDADRAWKTSDPSMQAGVLRVFADLLQAGCVQVRTCPVPWCPQCASTLSAAETLTQQARTTTALVPFSLLDSTGALAAGDVLLAWTTTPWTVPHHQALVCHPDALYRAMAHPDLPGRAWVSQDTADAWADHLGATVLADLATGHDLAGARYQAPWGPARQVLQSRHVTADTGTGLLHAVPGLSELDSRLGDELGLPTPEVLTPAGHLASSPLPGQEGLLAGPRASAPVLEALSASAWFSATDQAQEVQRCWRHGCDLLTRPSRQVFLHLSGPVRDRATALAGQLRFTPASSAHRLRAAMDARPDWCLSRQRSWGVPLALFLDRATGQPHPRAHAFVHRLADVVAHQGVEAWWSQPHAQWLDDDVDPASLEAVEDVLDVWFDSGCVPLLVGAGEAVVEGTDQHRGWFQSCLWLSAALDRPLPFKHVVTHGFVVGPDGRKLSKSTGGDVKSAKSPDWKSLPTDLVRTWALSGKEGSDKPWSQAGLDQSRAWLARWRGVVRFMLANALPATTQPVPMDDLPAWDLHWWNRSEQVSRHVVDLCASANPGQALSLLSGFAEDFSSQALGSWKDRLYCAPAHTLERRQLDAVLKACLGWWLHMLSPVAPRLVHEALSHAPGPVHARPAPRLDPALATQVEQVLALRRTLAPVFEAHAKSLPPAKRVLAASGLPTWPGQLLADALDVAAIEDPAHVLASADCDGQAWRVGPSRHDVCPRCRRAQSSLVAGPCRPCVQRSAGPV